MQFEYDCQFIDTNGKFHTVHSILEKENNGLGTITLYIDGVVQVLQNNKMCYMYGIDCIVHAYIREHFGLRENDDNSIKRRRYVECEYIGDQVYIATDYINS